MQIGDLSRRTGVSIDAIRFYERQRLLQSPARTEGGYRVFREEDTQAIRFIKGAQELGFSLDEIRELQSLRQQAVKACPKVRHLLQAKLASVQSKIASLKTLETDLESALRKCNVTLDRASCPVLEEISGNGRGRRRL